jgi:peptidyl-prolyl cis-trans isomerase SurA
MRKYNKTIFRILPGLFLSFYLFTAHAQVEVIDQVIAIVGKNIILESDIEAQYYQYRSQYGITESENTSKCRILEDMLYQKLLLNQAEYDSIEVSESEVEMSMDQRLRYFIGQFGSEEKLEDFYKKSILEIKDEMREMVHEQMMVDRVQQEITKDVNITPSDVRRFFKKLPADSIPLINAEVEVAQIVKLPTIQVEEKLYIKEKLKGIRTRLKNGESFKALAVLYSEDAGSAKKGGELGLHGRGELYPEFEAVAFKLKKGELSEILETKAGFHIIEMIERRGDYINVRHILLKVKASAESLAQASALLDSVANLIQKDSMTFEKAAFLFSSDEKTKNNGGLIINPATGTTKFEADQLDPQMFFVIDKLKVDDISKPILYETQEAKQAYRILQLKSRTEPHRANITDDYNVLQEWALNKKKMELVEEWIKDKIKDAYIKVDKKFSSCNFKYDWKNSEEE